jgi:hypothetical protein
MTPPSGELYRTLLRRALGGRSIPASLVLALVTGVAGGWLAARYLAAGVGDRPSSGMLAWLLVHFPHSAMYVLGLVAALQLATAYGDDARAGWTVQHLAAGGTRDRYVLALAAGGWSASALEYLLATSAWLATATSFGRPASLLLAGAAFLPVALLWLASPCAFAAAAVALTARTGRSVGLMVGVMLLPWLVLAAIRPDPDIGAPAWLPWLAIASPPYQADANIGTLGLIIAYPALLLGIAWLAAPGRLLRV